LNVDGAATFQGTVSLKSFVFGDAFSTITLSDFTRCVNGLDVTGSTSVAALTCTTLSPSGDVNVNSGKFTVASDTGNTVVAGTLSVTGTSTLAAVTCTTLSPSGNFAVNTNKFTVTAASGNTAIAGTLAVTGGAKVTGHLTITGQSLAHLFPSCRAYRSASQS